MKTATRLIILAGGLMISGIVFADQSIDEVTMHMLDSTADSRAVDVTHDINIPKTIQTQEQLEQQQLQRHEQGTQEKDDHAADDRSDDMDTQREQMEDQQEDANEAIEDSREDSRDAVDATKESEAVDR